MSIRWVFLLTLIFVLKIQKGTGVLSDLQSCHDDFTLKPPDGILKPFTFKWLAFVQYVHVTTGLVHLSKAPRVTLVQRQYVVGTAKDLMQLPKNYKLGNVIFGEYERDEFDCGLTRDSIKLGATCGRAYIEIPVEEVTPHPEYSRFGVGNSLALVKLIRPMKSNYMVPICLPSLAERTKKRKNKAVYLVDYISSVPHDFDMERMGKKTVKLYTHAQCRRHRMKWKLTSEGVTHVLCTSGCGVRTGAPIISQNHDGAFELIGVAAAGGECTKKSMRRRLIKEPPLYIDVYPYATWIINVIVANELPDAYPQSFQLTDGGNTMALRKEFLRKRKPQKKGWRARTYVAGNFCYKSAHKQRSAAFFYSEKFEVNADPPARLTINMQISAGIDCTIKCARLMLPNRLIRPSIEGIGGYNITVKFTTEWFPYSFYYALGLTGKNSSEKDRNEWIHENPIYGTGGK